MNHKLKARSRRLIQSLQDLRSESENRRAELYWTRQSVARNKKRAVALKAALARRSLLRVYTHHDVVEVFSFLRSPVVAAGYCPLPAILATNHQPASD